MVLIELDVTRFEREEGVVPTFAHLLARVEDRTALTDKDLAGEDVFV